MTGLSCLQQPLLDEIKHVTPLDFRVLIRQIFLDCSPEALPAAAADRSDPVSLAKLSSPLDDGPCSSFEVERGHRVSISRGATSHSLHAYVLGEPALNLMS